jgi:hypothetical protein
MEGPDAMPEGMPFYSLVIPARYINCFGIN